MTEEVLVSVKGFHTMEGMEEDQEIEVVSPGKYYFKNNAHYIFYEEKIEGSTDVIKNRITIRDGYLELQKKGAINTILTFDSEKETESIYQTPFGNVVSTIGVNWMDLYQTGKEIHAKIEYALALNFEHAADSRIEISIKPMGTDIFGTLSVPDGLE